MLKILALISATFIAALVALGQIDIGYVPLPLAIFGLATAGIIVGLSRI